MEYTCSTHVIHLNNSPCITGVAQLAMYIKECLPLESQLVYRSLESNQGNGCCTLFRLQTKKGGGVKYLPNYTICFNEMNGIKIHYY